MGNITIASADDTSPYVPEQAEPSSSEQSGDSKVGASLHLRLSLKRPLLHSQGNPGVNSQTPVPEMYTWPKQETRWWQSWK